MTIYEEGQFRKGYLEDGGLLSNLMLFSIFALLYSSLLPFLTVRFGVPTTPVYAAIVAGAIFMVLSAVRTRRFPAYVANVIYVILFYMVLISVQSLFYGDLAGTLEKRYIWAIVTICAIVCLCNSDQRSFLTLLRVTVAAAVALTHLEFFSGFALPVQMTDVVGRAAGLYMNPNTTAMFLASAVPVVAINLSFAKRLFWYVAIASSVLITFSRGGMILCAAMIAAAEFFSVGRLNRGGSIRPIVSFVVAAAVLLLCYIVYENSEQLFGLVLDDNAANRLRFGANDSSEIRYYVVQIALAAVQDSVLFGRGIGFAYAWDFPISVHNMFVLVLLEQGIVGLVWLASFLLSLLFIPRPFGIWAVLVFGVSGMFNHNMFDSPVYGLLVAMYVALPVVLEGPASSPRLAQVAEGLSGSRG